MPHKPAKKHAFAKHRRRRRRHYKKNKTTTRTGHLSLQQKVLSTGTVFDAGAYPTGIINKYDFTASAVPQWNTLSALFDQYRINAIKMTFLPTTNSPNSTTVNPSATFATSVDLDGDQNITTFDELLQCSNTKTSAWSAQGGLTPYKSVYFRPRIADVIAKSFDATGQPSSFSQALGSRSQWLDVSDRGQTPHYGLNVGWYFGNETVLLQQNLNIVITYYLQFRKVR